MIPKWKTDGVRIAPRQMSRDSWIASVVTPPKGPTKEAYAAAHLMSAAPELLEALENILASCEGRGVLGDGLVKHAEAAIAYAKGNLI